METPISAAPGVLVEFESPEAFYQLPLNLPPDERDAQVSELAAEIWAGGTEFQREATSVCYREIVESLADDGVLHAALGMFTTEDDRVSIANLIVRIEEIDPGRPEIICDSLHEMLSLEPHRDVHQVNLGCGPAVVSFHALNFGVEPTQSALVLAQIELYVPSPIGGYLLVFVLSTPSLAELPVYVSLMSQIGDSVMFSRDSEVGRQLPDSRESPRERTADDDIRSVFG